LVKSGFQKSAFRFIGVGLAWSKSKLRVKSCHLGGGSGFQVLSLAFIKVAQQSVQPTGGIRRHFQAFFWLQVFSALEANLVPPTSG